jgi:hypothetical protein
MEFLNKVWKCVEMRERLQERRLQQIDRLEKVVSISETEKCPVISSHFYASYLKFSLEIAKVTVGTLDCEEAGRHLDRIDATLSLIESSLPLCDLRKEEVSAFFDKKQV